MKSITLTINEKEYKASVISFVGEVLSVIMDELVEFEAAQSIVYSYEGKRSSVRVLRAEGKKVLILVPYHSLNILGERRQFPRYRLDMHMQLISESGEKFDVLTNNLSIYGAGIITGKKLKPGEYRFELTGLDISGKINLSDYKHGNYGGEFVSMTRLSNFELRRIILNHQLELMDAVEENVS